MVHRIEWSKVVHSVDTPITTSCHTPLPLSSLRGGNSFSPSVSHGEHTAVRSFPWRKTKLDVVRKIHTNIDVGYVDHKPSFTKTNTAVSDSFVYILRQII